MYRYVSMYIIYICARARDTHTHTHTHIYIYIYIYIHVLQSSVPILGARCLPRGMQRV